MQLKYTDSLFAIDEVIFYVAPGAWVELEGLPDPDDVGLLRGQYEPLVTETEKTLVKNMGGVGKTAMVWSAS